MQAILALLMAGASGRFLGSPCLSATATVSNISATAPSTCFAYVDQYAWTSQVYYTFPSAMFTFNDASLGYYCLTSQINFYLNGVRQTVQPSILAMNNFYGTDVGPLPDPRSSYYGEYRIEFIVSLPNGSTAYNNLWILVTNDATATCQRQLTPGVSPSASCTLTGKDRAASFMLATDPPITLVASSLFTTDCTTVSYSVSWLDSTTGNYVSSVPTIFSFDGDNLDINPGGGASGTYEL